MDEMCIRDSHWTSLGARYAFEAMAAQLGISQPIQNYDTYTVSTRCV